MKKNLLFASLAFIIALIATSCTPTPVITYPEDITGFWMTETSTTEKWYGLDITDAQTAIFITYYSEEEPIEQVMSLTYDATTGKGKISDEGKTLQLVATDSTLTITMVEGAVVFYRSTRPAKTAKLMGLWQSNRIDDAGIDILIYPKDAQGTRHITFISVDEFLEEKIAKMGILSDFNEETGVGYLTTENFSGQINIALDATPLTLTLEELKDIFVLTKQPRVENMPASLIGTWETSIPKLLSMTIVVTEDYACEINYEVYDKNTNETKTGTSKGTVYYCPTAGMGAVVPDDLSDHPSLVNLVGENPCGLFNVTSVETVSITFMGITLTLQKK